MGPEKVDGLEEGGSPAPRSNIDRLLVKRRFPPQMYPLYRMTLGLDRLWNQLGGGRTAGCSPQAERRCSHCQGPGGHFNGKRASRSAGITGTGGGGDDGQFAKSDDASAPESCSCGRTQPLLAERYRVVEELGKGNFSQVILVRDLFQMGVDAGRDLRVIKLLKPGLEVIGGAEEHWLQRLDQVDELRGGRLSLISYHGRIWHEGCFGLILEHLETPPPLSLDGALMTLRRLIVDIAGLLETLHRPPLSALHADVKPENILYSSRQGRYKLIDFGNCVPLDRLDEYRSTFEIQSLLYRAPEVLVGHDIGRPADLWSLGVVVLQFAREFTIKYEPEGAVKGPDPQPAPRPGRNISYPSPPSTDARSPGPPPPSRIGQSMAPPPFKSTTRAALLAEIAELMGPYPDTFRHGKFYTVDAVPLAGAFAKQTPAFWRRWRKSNIGRMVASQDAHFVDLVAGLLECDPERRLSAAQVLAHPFLAPLVPCVPAEAPPAADPKRRPPGGRGVDSVDAQFKNLLEDMMLC